MHPLRDYLERSYSLGQRVEADAFTEELRSVLEHLERRQVALSHRLLQVIVGGRELPLTIEKPEGAPSHKIDRRRGEADLMEGDQITGHVLSPRMTGPASFSQLTTEGPEPLGKADISADGSFNIIVPGLEVQSWRGGRLVLRIENARGQRAEGFISVAAFAKITRRAGPLGPRLLALLAGTETPADVAAIMSWFHDDPTRLPSAWARMGSGGDGRGPGNTGQTIAVSTLNSAHALHHIERTGSGGSGAASWSRFMQCVFSAFREKRGPLGQAGAGHKGDDDDDETQDPKEAARTARFVQNSLANFEKLLDLLLSDENAPTYAMSALDLTQYVCQRLQPYAGTARRWVNRVVGSRAACLLERRPRVGGCPGARKDHSPAARRSGGRRMEPHFSICPRVAPSAHAGQA